MLLQGSAGLAESGGVFLEPGHLGREPGARRLRGFGLPGLAAFERGGLLLKLFDALPQFTPDQALRLVPASRVRHGQIALPFRPPEFLSESLALRADRGQSRFDFVLPPVETGAGAGQTGQVPFGLGLRFAETRLPLINGSLLLLERLLGFREKGGVPPCPRGRFALRGLESPLPLLDQGALLVELGLQRPPPVFRDGHGPFPLGGRNSRGRN